MKQNKLDDFFDCAQLMQIRSDASTKSRRWRLAGRLFAASNKGIHLLVARLDGPGAAEKWDGSLAGWPQLFEGEHNFGTDGRPIAQWPRLKAGHSDGLGTGSR